MLILVYCLFSAYYNTVPLLEYYQETQPLPFVNGFSAMDFGDSEIGAGHTRAEENRSRKRRKTTAPSQEQMTYGTSLSLDHSVRIVLQITFSDFTETEKGDIDAVLHWLLMDKPPSPAPAFLDRSSLSMGSVDDACASNKCIHHICCCGI